MAAKRFGRLLVTMVAWIAIAGAAGPAMGQGHHIRGLSLGMDAQQVEATLAREGYGAQPMRAVASGERIAIFTGSASWIGSDRIEVLYGADGRASFIRRNAQTTGARQTVLRSTMHEGLQTVFGTPSLILNAVERRVDYLYYRSAQARLDCRSYPVDAFGPDTPLSSVPAFPDAANRCDSGFGVQILFDDRGRQPVQNMTWILWDILRAAPEPGRVFPMAGSPQTVQGPVFRAQRQQWPTSSMTAAGAWQANVQQEYPLIGIAHPDVLNFELMMMGCDLIMGRFHISYHPDDPRLVQAATVISLLVDGIRYDLPAVRERSDMSDDYLLAEVPPGSDILQALLSAHEIAAIEPDRLVRLPTNGFAEAYRQLLARCRGGETRLTAASSTAMGVTGDVAIMGRWFRFGNGQYLETSLAEQILVESPAGGGLGGLSTVPGVPSGARMEIRRVDRYENGGGQDLCRGRPTHIGLYLDRGGRGDHSLWIAAFDRAPAPRGSQEGRLCGTYRYER